MLKPWGYEEMKVGCCCQWYRLGVPAGLCLCSAVSPSLPSPLGHPAGPSVINKLDVMTGCASHKGRERGKKQFKFHQGWGGVRRGLIRWQTLLIAYSSVSSQAQTS